MTQPHARPALVVDRTPLYVDLDGTLIFGDMLVESLMSAARASLGEALAGIAALRHGRAALKRALAERASVDVSALPYNLPLIEWLRGQAGSGRPVFLATASDHALASRVAEHLGFFAGVLASNGRDNLKGRHKLEAIRRHCNGEGFAYCGNGAEDLPIFEAATEAIVVNADESVQAAAQRGSRVTHLFPGPGGSLRVWARALRVHQWLKNLLVFVPLVTSFRLGDPASLALAVAGFFVFCMVASGGYLVNDLLDLPADRVHPTKRNRPLACGLLPVQTGLVAGAGLLFSGLLLALVMSPPLAGWLALYAVLTLSYSVWIKRAAVFDLIALAALYTLRILAGGAAIGVDVSFWLLAFSVFLFFSLATVKRCAELVAIRAREESTAARRGYEASDMEVLKSIGIATSVASVLVLALYVQSPEVAHRYGAPRTLWLMLAGLLAWLAHVWLVTWRGRMHDDPLVFALRDATSRWLIAAMGLAFAFAAIAPGN